MYPPLRLAAGAGGSLCLRDTDPGQARPVRILRSQGVSLMHKKVAVILSGCGVYDGAEIHESVITLL
ncbi:isoprenoid biosynthesis protein ElbB, partial [Pseudomonas aeruginosa]